MALIQDEKKKAVAKAAIDEIKHDMVIGLGSGTTITYLLEELAQRVKEGLSIQGIPSSKKTEKLAIKLNIPLAGFPEIKQLDIAIDGADEIDEHLHLLKGGGGSLVREKIVASTAKKLVIIADDSKSVKQLGAFPLPIEVVPFGWETTARKIAALGAKSVLRKNNGKVFVSDNGNYILDCTFDNISQPQALHENIKQLVGVVETGLFVGMADKVILAGHEGITVHQR